MTTFRALSSLDLFTPINPFSDHIGKGTAPPASLICNIIDSNVLRSSGGCHQLILRLTPFFHVSVFFPRKIDSPVPELEYLLHHSWHFPKRRSLSLTVHFSLATSPETG
jgi:hypothetical protein